MRLPLPSIVLLTSALCLGAATAGEPVSTPAAATTDRGFAGGTPSAALQIESRDGRAFVLAQIAGKTLTLLVDPAGANVLSPAAVTALGLGVDAELTAAAGAPAVRVATVVLGSYSLRDQTFYVVDLGRWPEIEGAPVDGVLGPETFERIVLTIDHARRLLTLTDPAAFRAPLNAVSLPLRFVERLPLVAASVDGRVGEFAIEPGTRGPLTLHGGFVREHELLDRYPHGHESVVGWGISGPTRGFATRVGAVEIGGLRAPAVVATLQTEERKLPGSRAVAGSIGGRLLARFTVTIDFIGRRLLLQPGATLATPDAHDRSGMWLNLDGEDLIIDALQPNGPAARAQLQPHDRIVAIDGVPATELTLAGVRAMFRDSLPDTRVRVTARRDGKVIYANFILTDLVPAPLPIP